MGNTRKELDDEVYQKRHDYYLKNREKTLARARVTYQMERVVRCKTAKKIRDAARHFINHMSSAEREIAELEAIQAVKAGPLRIKGCHKRDLSSKFVRDYKTGKPCCDCTVVFPYYVLDFDHVQGQKGAEISELVSKGRSIEAISLEIQKCELVCANCHRIRTFEMRTDLK